MMARKRKISEKEKRAVTAKLASRLPEMKIEFLWAFGLPMQPDFITPPTWVKNLITCDVKPPDVKPPDAKLMTELLMEFSGFAEGFSKAAFAMLEHPTASDVEKEESNPLLTQLRLQMLQALQAVQLKEDVAGLPEVLKPKTAEEHLFHSAAQFEAMKLANDDQADSASNEIEYMMWVFWREVETAKTRGDLHAWLTDMQFTSASFKLVEKICRKIGFRSVQSRPSKRKPKK